MDLRVTPLDLTPKILIQIHIEFKDHKFWDKISRVQEKNEMENCHACLKVVNDLELTFAPYAHSM